MCGQPPHLLLTFPQAALKFMPLVETLWLVDEDWRLVAASDASAPPPAYLDVSVSDAQRRTCSARVLTLRLP